MQRNALSRRKRLLADGKGVTAIFTFDLPGQMGACDIEAFAISGCHLACALDCRNIR